MKLNNFFSLVHNLSEKEHEEFSKFMYGKKKSHTFLLYTRILKSKDLSDDSVKRIKGKEFKDPSKFCIYRDKVMDAILTFIVQSKEPVFPIITRIKEAFIRGADEYGEETLFDEVAKLENEEDYTAIQVFYALIEDLQTNHGVKIQIPGGLIKPIEIKTRIIRSQILNGAIEATRKAPGLPENELQNLLSSIKNVANRKYESKGNQRLGLILQRNIAFLKSDYAAAFRLGEAVLNSLEGEQYGSSVYSIVKELRLLAINAAYLNFRDRSTAYCMRLSRMESIVDSENEFLIKTRIKVKAAIAYKLIDLPLAQECLDELNHTIMLFHNARHIANRYHTIGLAFFFGGSYTRASECFRIVRKSLPKGSKFLKWEPQLLIAICAYEAGESRKIDDLLRSAKRGATSSGMQYPLRAIDLFQRIFDSPTSDHRLLYHRGLTILKELLLIQDEKRISLAIQFEYWIEAKMREVSMKKIIEEQSQRESIAIMLEFFA